MNITIDKQVNYDIKDVVVKNILLNKDYNGNLIVIVPYTWLDVNGKVLRVGTNRYTEDQLIQGFQAQGQDFTVFSTVLKELIPSQGTSHNCNVLFQSTVTAIRGYSGTENGKGKWFSETLTESQLEAEIAPITIQQLKDLVVEFTQTIFA